MSMSRNRVFVRPAGFTLVEVMLAMGILAVGLAMAAAAFPTAIEQTRVSALQTLSVLIAENAKATVQAKLRHQDIAGATGKLNNWNAKVDGVGAGADDRDRKYVPDGDGNSRYGWMLLGCRFGTSGQNDYQFVVLPYRELPGVRNEPVLVTGVDIDGDQRIATFSNAADIAVGSPIVDEDTGAFAFITGVDLEDNKKANLTGNLGVSGTATKSVWLVPHRTGANHPADSVAGAASPAIGCFVFRTSLAP